MRSRACRTAPCRAGRPRFDGGDGFHHARCFSSRTRKEERFDRRAVDTYADGARSPLEGRHGRNPRLGASLLSPMIHVGTYPTRTDAELAQTVLAAAGIPSVVAADDAGGAYPFDLTGGARLLVDEADAEVAAALLSERSDANRDEER